MVISLPVACGGYAWIIGPINVISTLCPGLRFPNELLLSLFPFL